METVFSFRNRYFKGDGGALAQNRLDTNGATMTVFNHITDNAHAESSTLSHRLGCEEIIKESASCLIAHAFPIITNGNGQHLPALVTGRETDCNIDGRHIIGGCSGLVPYGIAGIVHRIEHGPTDILRNNQYGFHRQLVVFLNGDVEVLVVGTHGMIGQPDILFHHSGNVSRHSLTILTT